MEVLQTMQEAIDAFYQCPICECITQGYFFSATSIGLECGHTFRSFGQLRRYEKMKHRCHGIELYLTFDDDFIQRSHSFLAPVFGSIVTQESQTNATYLTYNDTGAVSRNIGVNGAANMSMLGLAGDNTLGIQVGTGSAANTTSTASLGTLIVHGNGAGQLSYGGNAFGAVSVGATTTVAVSRPLTNNSAGNITINEAGMVGFTNDTGTTGRKMLHARDVLGTPKTINSGGASSTATYNQQIIIT